MQDNFAMALKEVLKHEGGYVNHPSDPGGATNKGITIATYRKWVDRDGTVDDLKRITDAQVSKVYRSVYWNAIKGDDLQSGVDYAVFDFAVNSGPTRAAKYLQAVVGATQDGKIGPKTIKAVNVRDPKRVVNELCDRRQAFLEALKTFSTFGKGWTRRVAEVRSLALKMSESLESTPKPVIAAPVAPTPVSKPVIVPMPTPALSIWDRLSSWLRARFA